MNGIYSALMGVFNADNKVNEDGVRALVRHNIERCKVDGLYVNGSTGENFLMNLASKKQVFKAAAEAAKGDVHMIAHIGSPVLDDVLELADFASEHGYEAVSAVTPFYYKFSPEEIKDYYRAIAKNSKLPVIAYYIPALSGVTLAMSDLSDIMKIDNVAGIKFTSNDMFTLEMLRAEWPDKLLLSGFDEMLLSYAVLGTNGAIGSTFNIIGHWAKKVYESAKANDYATARKMQHSINVVVADLIANGLYGTLKEITKLYGVPAGECKPPMAKTTVRQVEAAKEINRYILKIDAEMGL